jgi:sigma-B regulation protein RsbU (phosphoserine phosphatase)
MVFRGGEVVRLEEGGPVVGLFRAGVYKQGIIQMQRGDVLVGFTDGVSEAMNANDEEFEEERLIETVRACRGLPATEIIDRLMSAADAFAAGAPQHDDTTLVVVRVLGSRLAKKTVLLPTHRRR